MQYDSYNEERRKRIEIIFRLEVGLTVAVQVVSHVSRNCGPPPLVISAAFYDAFYDSFCDVGATALKISRRGKAEAGKA